MSPTQLTLKELKKNGYLPAIVEKYNRFAKVRQDAWGVVDIICLGKGEILFIQCTTDTGGQFAKHKEKIEKSPNRRKILESGARFELWAWKKAGKYGKRKVYEVRKYIL